MSFWNQAHSDEWVFSASYSIINCSFTARKQSGVWYCHATCGNDHLQGKAFSHFCKWLEEWQCSHSPILAASNMALPKSIAPPCLKCSLKVASPAQPPFGWAFTDPLMKLAAKTGCPRSTFIQVSKGTRNNDKIWKEASEKTVWK